MHAHDGRVDHLHRRVMSGGQRLHDPVPDTCPPPANEAIVASGVRAKALRQIAPRRTRSQDPEYAVEDTTVIDAGNAAWLVREHRPDEAPFIVAEFIPHDSKLRSWRAWNHTSGVGVKADMATPPSYIAV